jgi:DNA repair photolyase
MIISASRRTDIPAYFSDWFMNRIRAGYFYRLNPFNAHQVKRINLKPKDVDIIVFWTKNPKPLIKHLLELDELGYRYYFQFTLNSYNHHIEPNVPPLAERIETFRRLGELVGPSRVIWRYDPIILSSETSFDFHAESIGNIASALNGSTNRLVISFLDFYGKVAGRLKDLERHCGISIHDIRDGVYRTELMELLSQIKHIGDKNGLSIFSCAEDLDLSEYGILHGSCIDGALIQTLVERQASFANDKSQRGSCQCVESIDMGMYNTCSFKCKYCYASGNDKLIGLNLSKHNVDSASIIGDFGEVKEAATKNAKTAPTCQQGELF